MTEQQFIKAKNMYMDKECRLEKSR